MDEKQKTESDFFDYVSESYRCFLAGDDDRCEEVDNVKAAEFDSRANEIRGQNEALQEVSDVPFVTPCQRCNLSCSLPKPGIETFCWVKTCGVARS